MKQFKVCVKCGKTSLEGRIITSKGVCYCERCYQRRNHKIYPLPKRGEITLNEKGNPICHICGEAHSKLMAHVWQIHKLSALDYKLQFGLDLYNGIMSEKSTNKARQNALKHIELNKQNLLKGAPFRFSPGYSGRTQNKISQQTLQRLKQQSFIKLGKMSSSHKDIK